MCVCESAKTNAGVSTGGACACGVSVGGVRGGMVGGMVGEMVGSVLGGVLPRREDGDEDDERNIRKQRDGAHDAAAEPPRARIWRIS